MTPSLHMVELVTGSAADADAVDALMALQYARREAERIVHATMLARPNASTIEALIRAALEDQGRSPSLRAHEVEA